MKQIHLEEESIDDRQSKMKEKKSARTQGLVGQKLYKKKTTLVQMRAENEIGVEKKTGIEEENSSMTPEESEMCTA